MVVDVQARVFTSVPIDEKQLETFLRSENLRVDHYAMCQGMICSGYYDEAMKRLSKAFPDVEFTTVYFTDLSMSALFTEKYKTGELTQKETRYKYTHQKVCEALEVVLKHFIEEHGDAELTCQCPFCVFEKSVAERLYTIMKKAIDTYAKEHELHEIKLLKCYL